MVLRMDGPIGPPPKTPSGTTMSADPFDFAKALEGLSLRAPSAAAGEGPRQRLPQVYLGDREWHTPGYDTSAWDGKHLMELDRANSLLYGWFGTEKFDAWGDLLVEQGWVDEADSRDFDTLDGVWRMAAAKSAEFQEWGRNLTPWDVVTLMSPLAGSGGGRGGSGGGPTTTVSTSVNLTDPDTARAIVNRALSAKLGRAANDEEVASFINVLNAAERAAPTTTTSTRSADGSRVSSTTTGGIAAPGREQLAIDEAMENPEYGAYQAASTYYNALISALGG